MSAYFRIYFEHFSYTGVHIKYIVLIKVFKTIVIPRVKFVFDKHSGILAFAATNPIYLLRLAWGVLYGNCYSTVHRVTNLQKVLKKTAVFHSTGAVDFCSAKIISCHGSLEKMALSII